MNKTTGNIHPENPGLSPQSREALPVVEECVFAPSLNTSNIGPSMNKTTGNIHPENPGLSQQSKLGNSDGGAREALSVVEECVTAPSLNTSNIGPSEHPALSPQSKLGNSDVYAHEALPVVEECVSAPSLNTSNIGPSMNKIIHPEHPALSPQSKLGNSDGIAREALPVEDSENGQPKNPDVSTGISLEFTLPTDYMKLNMFANAKNLVIKDTTITAAGRDIIIHYCPCHGPELVTSCFNVSGLRND